MAAPADAPKAMKTQTLTGPNILAGQTSARLCPPVAARPIQEQSVGRADNVAESPDEGGAFDAFGQAVQRDLLGLYSRSRSGAGISKSFVPDDRAFAEASGTSAGLRCQHR